MKMRTLISGWAAGSALAAAFALLLFRTWWMLPEGVQVGFWITLPLIALCFAGRAAAPYLQITFAVAALSGFVWNLVSIERTFNLSSAQYPFLAWSLFALLLAYAFGSRILLALGLILGEIFLAGTLAVLLGIYWDKFPFRLETLLATGLVTFMVSMLRSHEPAFRQVYTFIGLLTMFLAALCLSAGDETELPVFWHTAVIFYRVVCLTGVGVALLLGIWRRMYRTMISCAMLVLVIVFSSGIRTGFFGIWEWNKIIPLILIGIVIAGFAFAFRWSLRAQAEVRPGFWPLAAAVLLVSNVAMLAAIIGTNPTRNITMVGLLWQLQPRTLLRLIPADQK
jgi:hypothetical protein